MIIEVIEDIANKSHEVRNDVPISFADRRFTIRYVYTDYIDIPTGGS